MAHMGHRNKAWSLFYFCPFLRKSFCCKPMPTISQIFLLSILLSSSIHTTASLCDSCYGGHQSARNSNNKFEQKNKRFWEFNPQSNSWVEVKLPYNLVSCINDNCTVVASIQESGDGNMEDVNSEERDDDRGVSSSYPVLFRERISLTRMSELSIWITGPSGSIYERFWNGLQWVIAPHDLPVSAGRAVAVFMVYQTILALSESGLLYQMQLSDETQPIWVEFMLELNNKGMISKGNETVHLSFGVLSNDRERIYFCTKNGLLLELVVSDPPRWANHGRPPGASLVAVADAEGFRPRLMFVVSGAGDLYEYDPMTKPPWKKHIHQEGSTEEARLARVRPCSVHGLSGPHSSSLFLLTKGGELIERRLHQRKWKWIAHGSPKGHLLTSVTCINQDSLFATTAAGLVFEYQIQKISGGSQSIENQWFNHEHPSQAKVATGVPGLQLQPGRLIFPLDDGRLGELHLSGHGGETLGPNAAVSTRRKSLLKYVWLVLDAPETEGWNREYCTEDRGPSNCMTGSKDERLSSNWRKDDRMTQQSYLLPVGGEEENHSSIPDKGMDEFFRLRLMHEGKSFFLVTTSGLVFEYLNTENAWFWLRHEHSTKIEKAVGSYNGSLFMVDEHGSLLIRERSSIDLTWVNCSAMRNGRQVISGPPWDGIPGQNPQAKPDDAIFFVSRTGRLLQFTVVLRKFKWKDCWNPPGTKVASIVDQERFRANIVFVTGKNGRLYQYNKVTEIWHEHSQSQHLILSRSPGTAMRSSDVSLKGSLFMLSETGGLVEYRWGSMDGWSWIEHGTPYTNMTLVGAPGPCFRGDEVLLIGSDGNVHLRYLEGGEWKWMDCGFPYALEENNGNEELCKDMEFSDGYGSMHESLRNCDPKVSTTRPIPYSEDSVIFELRDGRLGELKRDEDKRWTWSRTIGTPASSCMENFWTSLAS